MLDIPLNVLHWTKSLRMITLLVIILWRHYF